MAFSRLTIAFAEAVQMAALLALSIRINTQDDNVGVMFQQSAAL
jgi:hypothetical protein